MQCNLVCVARKRQVEDLLGLSGTKAGKMTGVMLGCNSVCMLDEKENFVENVPLEAEPIMAWAKSLGSQPVQTCSTT